MYASGIEPESGRMIIDYQKYRKNNLPSRDFLNRSLMGVRISPYHAFLSPDYSVFIMH